MAKVTNKVEEPVVEEVKTTPKPKKATTKKGVVANCELLNVREEASTSAKVLNTIKAGTEVTILGSEADFYKTAEGYVMKKFINC